ncbi:TPA: hypothetical protein J1460_003253 [Escherichia coli]|nr:hypothetical protein [Escherichia coli]
MMTVKRMFMLLFRTVIVWPSVLTGCLMMLYFVGVASDGVTGLAQRYEAESARWRDAPEGTVMMRRCPSRPFEAPVTTGEWRALPATDAECLRAPRSFRQAAEADFQSLHTLALTLLLASVVLEGILVGILRRKTASVPVSPHCGCGRGCGAVAHWPDHDNDAIPQKGGQV